MKTPLFVTLAAILGLATLSTAQSNEKFTNLKVLDSTISRPQLLDIMKSFAGGLGVKCEYCHVERKLPNGEHEDDFASDQNNMKLVAREMMKMTRLINGELIPNAMKDSSHKHVAVQCVTCHRGQPVPHLIQDVLMAAYTDGGADSLLATYASLRERYYGRHTFDFSDYVLSGIGSELAAKDKTGAVKILERNTEYYPKSAGAWFALGRVFAETGDTAKARETLQKCLGVNPDFRPAKQLLEQLDKAPKQ